jgi:hypothetical protein
MRLLLILFFSFSLITNNHAQISEGGKPFSSSNKNYLNIIEHTITPPTNREIQSLIFNNKSSYCVGLKIPTLLDPSKSGTWVNHNDGSRSWYLKIKCANAIGLSLNYKEFRLPTGSEVFLYNETKTHVIGKFTASRNKSNPITHTQIIEGETTILEYHEPANCNGALKIEIESVVYYFRGFEDYLSPYNKKQNNSRAESCQIDVACSPENNGWSDQIDAVVHFVFPDGGGYYVCSGSVINNTDQDCKPYILTAWHCGEHSANQNLSNYTWYWNYQKTSCQPNSNSSNPSKGNQTMTNGTVRSTSGSGTLNNPPSTTNYQVAGSDFTLIELGSNIPSSYNAFYAGWDKGTSLKSSGVSIHHPAGSAKKISTYTSNLSSDTYNGGAFNAHWEVYWSSTSNGFGVTEGGSSGSPIFDQNKRIVGQLSGGNSYCGSNPDSDLYGKFSSNWTSNGSTNGSQLAPWLDPGNSNVTTLDGTYSPCPGPSISCSASANSNNINIGNSTNFTGTSNSTNSTWNWDFDVNNVGGVNPPSSNVQNPSGVTYSNAGNFTISLTVTNSSGNSCSSVVNVTVSNNTSIISENNSNLKIYPNPNNGSFKIDLSNLNNEEIRIYDQMGRMIKSIKVDDKKYLNKEINVMNINAGVYYIKTKK